MEKQVDVSIENQISQTCESQTCEI
jgi:hypothetical protein